MLVKGKKVEDYEDGALASIVGYSFQNPFTQISGVKETVYEELAYGMENIGIPREEMIKKVEELTAMFHLESLVDKIHLNFQEDRNRELHLPPCWH